MWILNPSSKQFKSILYKGLSSLLSVAIVFTTSDFLQAASLPSTPVPVVNLGTFTLPGNLGMISDAYRSGNDKRLVFIIQDLHIHPPVQKRIRDLLDFLFKQPQLQQTRLVGVEGAEGKIPTMAEAARPNPSNKRKIADYLIEQGELTGAEAYAIEQGRGDLLWGIETKKYYKADRDLYVMTQQSRKNLRQRLEFLDARLSEVINRKLKQPAAVQEVSRLEKALEEGGVRPTAVLRSWLAQGADLPLQMRPYPRLRALSQVMEAQSKNLHPELMSETRNFLSLLSSYLMSSERRELEYLGKSAPELYYLRLAWMARERHLRQELPATLRGYLEGLSTIRSFSSYDLEQEFSPLHLNLRRS